MGGVAPERDREVDTHKGRGKQTESRLGGGGGKRAVPSSALAVEAPQQRQTPNDSGEEDDGVKGRERGGEQRKHTRRGDKAKRLVHTHTHTHHPQKTRGLIGHRHATQQPQLQQETKRAQHTRVKRGGEKATGKESAGERACCGGGNAFTTPRETEATAHAQPRDAPRPWHAARSERSGFRQNTAVARAVPANR